MRWSKLPKEYQELEQGFDNVGLVPSCDKIDYRFHWAATPQGHKFWQDCFKAKFKKCLPKIPDTTINDCIQ